MMSASFHEFNIELDDGRHFILAIDLAADSPQVLVTICPPASAGLIKWIHHQSYKSRKEYDALKGGTNI